MTSLEAVMAFSVFAERLNFTRAAEVLNISQPALHVKIAKLQESLGVTLYRRRGRELQLTAAGQRVARFGRETSTSVAEFEAGLRGEATREPVILAAGEGSLLYLLPESVRQFIRARQAPLRIIARDRDGMLEAVRSCEAHLGVAALDSVPDDLLTKRLLRAEQVLVLPAKHPLARKKEVLPEDLSGLGLIVPPLGRPHRELIARMLLDRGTPWTAAVETTGWPAMLELVNVGAGLAIVNSICRLPAGLVARRLLRFPATHYFVVYRRGRTPDAVKHLIDLIVEYASRT